MQEEREIPVEQIQESPDPVQPLQREVDDVLADDQARQKERQRWWLIEIWQENREMFKALIEHVLTFALLIASLVAFHYFLEKIPLPSERKHILDTIDFWGIVLGLVIFGISFIMKLLVLSFGGKRNVRR